MFALHPLQTESVTLDEAGRTVPMVERNRNYVVGGPVCVDWVTTGRTLEEFGRDRHRYRAWVEAGMGGVRSQSTRSNEPLLDWLWAARNSLGASCTS